MFVMALDLAPAADQMSTIVAGIADEQLSAATPCEGMDVAAMLAHVQGLSVAFRDAARKVQGPTTSTAPGAAPKDLSSRWRDEIPVALEELAQAWREPGALDGMTTAGGVTLPAEIMLTVADNELVIHAWDLAQATGQPYAAAPENLEASWQMVSNTPDEPEARAGLFGPRIPIADDAPLLDRVLAYAGRDPQWKAA
jgi:uncharacterized protein (TIGR03086 family)